MLKQNRYLFDIFFVTLVHIKYNYTNINGQADIDLVKVNKSIVYHQNVINTGYTDGLVVGANIAAMILGSIVSVSKYIFKCGSGLFFDDSRTLSPVENDCDNQNTPVGLGLL